MKPAVWLVSHCTCAKLLESLQSLAHAFRDTSKTIMLCYVTPATFHASNAQPSQRIAHHAILRRITGSQVARTASASNTITKWRSKHAPNASAPVETAVWTPTIALHAILKGIFRETSVSAISALSKIQTILFLPVSRVITLAKLAKIQHPHVFLAPYFHLGPLTTLPVHAILATTKTTFLSAQNVLISVKVALGPLLLCASPVQFPQWGHYSLTNLALAISVTTMTEQVPSANCVKTYVLLVHPSQYAQPAFQSALSSGHFHPEVVDALQVIMKILQIQYARPVIIHAWLVQDSWKRTVIFAK